ALRGRDLRGEADLLERRTGPPARADDGRGAGGLDGRLPGAAPRDGRLPGGDGDDVGRGGAGCRAADEGGGVGDGGAGGRAGGRLRSLRGRRYAGDEEDGDGDGR